VAVPIQHKTKGLAKFDNVYYKKGGLPSLLPIVLMVTMKNLGVDVASIRASPLEPLHAYELVGLPDSQGGLMCLNV
jgi:hypothetical protein